MLKKLANRKKIDAGAYNKSDSMAKPRLERDFEKKHLHASYETLTFPDPTNNQNFIISIKPKYTKDNLWENELMTFKIEVPDEYPMKPPLVRYTGPKRLFHPNIEGEEEKEGNWAICLNILRADWSPIMDINTVLYGLHALFSDPNIDDPLPGVAREAAQMIKDNYGEYKRKVKRWQGMNYS